MRTYLACIAARTRSERVDAHLAFILTFVAGATNAGGYMAIQQYTSHMSGIVSGVADNLVIGEIRVAMAGLAALSAFIAGAATTAILVNWARRRDLHSEFALPLLLEALLLCGFGVLGPFLHHQFWLLVPTTVIFLCFIMGLQNAIITKISQSRIRTTHVTGIVTDIGIELGKLTYINLTHGKEKVRADRKKLGTLSAIISLFLLGGIVGAFGFQRIGYIFAFGLSAIIAIIALPPVAKDLRAVQCGRKA